MKKNKNDEGDAAAKARFSDALVIAKDGEEVDPLVEGADPTSRAYTYGANAKRMGRPRDAARGLSWLAGYEDTDTPEAKE